MNKAAIKRMTRRTEFYIFLVLILMIAVIGVISQGQLFEPTQIVTGAWNIHEGDLVPVAKHWWL